MNPTIRQFILTPALKRTQIVITCTILGLASPIAVLMATGRGELAPYVLVLAMLAMNTGNLAHLLRHAATTSQERGPFPHQQASIATVTAMLIPYLLLIEELNGWKLYLMATPISLAFLYVFYAILQLLKRTAVPRKDNHKEKSPQ